MPVDQRWHIAVSIVQPVQLKNPVLRRFGRLVLDKATQRVTTSFFIGKKLKIQPFFAIGRMRSLFFLAFLPESSLKQTKKRKKKIITPKPMQCVGTLSRRSRSRAISRSRRHVKSARRVEKLDRTYTFNNDWTRGRRALLDFLRGRIPCGAVQVYYISRDRNRK